MPDTPVLVRLSLRSRAVEPCGAESRGIAKRRRIRRGGEIVRDKYGKTGMLIAKPNAMILTLRWPGRSCRWICR
ncbi:hypothetical protein J4733_08620 [Klebsiella pneumoniae]|uniref:Uncharacterized protein n=1 Tax=Klebsiella pneumoniae TaxID=573 RepID=A0A939NLF1_KLEPN|nr:hypothetical protein [Klebsiella pneumoniae]